MTRVLPEPAPASTSTGPSVRTTACLCWGLRSERSSAMDAGVATAERPPEPVLILRRKRAWSAFRHAQAPSVPAASPALEPRPPEVAQGLRLSEVLLLRAAIAALKRSRSQAEARR